MIDTKLSQDVCELLDSCLHTVDELEAFLLLHGDPARGWQPAELARSIGCSLEAAGDALRQLLARGLAADVGAGVRLADLGPIAVAAFGALAHTCAVERAAVHHYVAQRPLARLRWLADAFTHGPAR